ncbi:MAG: hypothetical protein ACRDDY_13515 [Clostridium sp.]|uniref:hypothetical protein n=1 Tax=Clostridium sp. TaxID=1506 RepID=UPI003EE42EFD
MDAKIDKIEIQVSENTQILKALEHSSKVSKAEHYKIIIDVATISGTVESIKEDICNVEVITASN